MRDVIAEIRAVIEGAARSDMDAWLRSSGQARPLTEAEREWIIGIGGIPPADTDPYGGDANQRSGA